MNIKYSFKAERLIGELEKILHNKYFSFEYQTNEYVDNLREVVENSVLTLGTSLPKAGKKYQSSKYGLPTHFVRCKSNSQTTWYILVKISGDRALVTYIHNNHEKIHSIATTKR